MPGALAWLGGRTRQGVRSRAQATVCAESWTPAQGRGDEWAWDRSGCRDRWGRGGVRRSAVPGALAWLGGRTRQGVRSRAQATVCADGWTLPQGRGDGWVRDCSGCRDRWRRGGARTGAVPDASAGRFVGSRGEVCDRKHERQFARRVGPRRRAGVTSGCGTVLAAVIGGAGRSRQERGDWRSGATLEGGAQQGVRFEARVTVCAGVWSPALGRGDGGGVAPWWLVQLGADGCWLAWRATPVFRDWASAFAGPAS